MSMIAKDRIMKTRIFILSMMMQVLAFALSVFYAFDTFDSLLTFVSWSFVLMSSVSAIGLILIISHFVARKAIEWKFLAMAVYFVAAPFILGAMSF